jgi:A/G-specific adenine glycosylase
VPSPLTDVDLDIDLDIDVDALLAWADTARRDLPWRTTRDPWAVLVSELMLQQTQVARVVPKYHEFVEAYPTPSACAAVPASEVVTRWAGLGYNRRALNLHRCACVVTDQHGGVVPDDLAALLALPGIGPYTARAVLVFAYERDEAIVDTNVARLFARWVGRRLGARQVQHLADGAVRAGSGWAWNQGLLDLGATVCTKRAPGCDRCPARPWCAWLATGRSEPDPADGTAGVSARQARFEGSDRQGRGRLVDALRRTGHVDAAALATTAGWPHDLARARRVAETLVVDELARWRGDGALVFAE